MSNQPTYVALEYWRDRAKKAEADRDGLREALNTIAYEPIGDDEAGIVTIYDAIVKIARKALEHTP